MTTGLIAMFFASAIAAINPGSAGAEPTNHIQQAREHMNAALTQGQTGHTKALVQHARMALDHIKMAQQEKPMGDLVKAQDSLAQTIDAGEKGDANKATEHAKESVEYLDAVIGALGG